MINNNKGFTLVEVLAVVVILISILTLALPSINKTLKESKEKEIEKQKEVVISEVELKLSKELKNNYYNELLNIYNNNGNFYIKIGTLKEKYIITSKQSDRLSDNDRLCYDNINKKFNIASDCGSQEITTSSTYWN